MNSLLEANTRFCADASKTYRRYTAARSILYKDHLEIKDLTGSYLLNVPLNKIAYAKFAGLGTKFYVDDKSYGLSFLYRPSKSIFGAFGLIGYYIGFRSELKTVRSWKKAMKQYGIKVKRALIA